MTRNLEPDQWRNREEWRSVAGRRDSCYKTGWMDRNGVWLPEDGDSCYKSGWTDSWMDRQMEGYKTYVTGSIVSVFVTSSTGQ